MLKKNLFGADGPTIEVDDVLASNARSGSAEATLSGGKSFEALGGKLTFQGNGRVAFELESGAISLDAAVPVATADGSGDRDHLVALGEFHPPKGKQWGVLEIAAGLQAGASGSIGSAVALELAAQGKTGFRYRLVRAVPSGDSGPQAVGRLIGEARLPFAFDITSFGRDEWHEFSTETSLSLSAALTAGKNLTFANPLAGLRPELDAPDTAARLTLLVKASVGLALVDRMRMAAGRLAAERPTWVRVRLERHRQRSLSLAASLSAELWFNKKVIESVLDYTLGRVGYYEIKANLHEIAQAIDPANLTQEALEAKLSKELFELAQRVLPIDEVTGAIADRVAGLLELVEKIQEAYGTLDGEFQGLVDHLLAGAGLAPGSELRGVLGKLRDLNGLDAEQLFDKVLGGKAEELETLIDLLGVKSLQELLLEGRQALFDEVQRLAAQSGKLLTLLDTVDKADLRDVLVKITGSERTRRVVELLRAAPSDPAALRAFLDEKADAELRSTIEKLAGRAIDAITEKKQVKRLLAWAEDAHQALTDITSVDDRLRTELAGLKDRLGFVATFALDRVTRSAALVDVELDPESIPCQKAFRSLAEGDVVEFTEKLPFEEDPKEEGEQPSDAELPFHFHSFILSTERSTQLSWVFAPSIGAGTQRTRKAFDTSRIEIVPGETNRRATYTGGLILSTGAGKDGLLRSWMSSTTLCSTARGQGPAITRPYDQVRHELRLSTARYDDEAIAERLPALDRMLDRLGFPSSQVTIRVPTEATATRIQVDLAFPGEAVGRLLDPLKGVTPDKLGAVIDDFFLGAGADWLDEPLIPLRWKSLRAGNVMRHIVSSPEYRERWQKADWTAPFTFTKKGAPTVSVAATPDSEKQNTSAEFGPALQALALSRSWSSASHVRLGKAWSTVEGGGAVEHEDLTELARAFRRMVRTSSRGLFAWKSPLFPLFLALQRVGTADLSVVAAISWRNAEDEWQPTQYVRVPK